MTDWLNTDYIFAIREHSHLAWWLYFIIVWIFLMFWVMLAPRLRAFIRQWRQWDDAMWRRLSEYYGALGGPAVIQRNLVPELPIILYLFIAANLFWHFQNPPLPIISILVALSSLALWKGEKVQRRFWVFINRRRRVEPTPEDLAEMNPLEFNR